MTTSPEDTGTAARPVRARLDKFADLDAFVDGYSQYFFDGGMLLPTRSPREVGARIVLQLEIRDGVVVARAEALVERIRNGADGNPVGMVLRFEHLDDATSALVHRILSERKQRRTAEHPSVSSAPSRPPVPSPRPEPAAPAPTTSQNAPLPGNDAAGEALDAIASSLDESFDAIFGGGDRDGDSFGVAAAATAPAPVPTPAPSPVEAAPQPFAPSVHRQPAGLPPNATVLGMPAFDASQFEPQRVVTPVALEPEAPEAADVASATDEPESGFEAFDIGSDNRFGTDRDDSDKLLNDNADTGEAAPSESSAALDALFAEVAVPPPSATEDASGSHPVGRLALQRVSRSGSAPDHGPGAEPTRTAARAILKSMTGEMTAIPDEGPNAEAASQNDDALDRMLAVEPAPLSPRASDDVLDDLLGDLAPGKTPPTGQAASANTALAPKQTAAPTGFVGRLLLWLRSLFGG